MGKGKGKTEDWGTNVAGGVTLVEFQNMRRGRVVFFINQIGFKIGLPVKAVYANHSRIFFSIRGSRYAIFRAF
jgi:ribosomal protein L16/L10AE